MSGPAEPGVRLAHPAMLVGVNVEAVLLKNNVYCVWNKVEFLLIPSTISEDLGWGK